MRVVLLALALLITPLAQASSLQYQLGPETILLQGGVGNSTHIAFPHAASDGQGSLWLVYRKAATHVGTLGTLWLAKYRLADMSLLSNTAIYQSPDLDPRDPTITVKDGVIYISFFQYNYTFNMVRQFVLLVDANTQTPLGPEKMLQNSSILNHSSSAPLTWVGDHWILPIYYVDNFYSQGTDIGYFRFDQMLTKITELPLTTIGKGASANSFFLEPAIAIDGDHWISLFRTSLISEGPGGVEPMMMSESFDAGASWSAARDTPFYGHHPRIVTDLQGRIWAGFRDVTNYDETNYKTKITLWQLNASADSTITVFETTTPDPNNWDCGYPSWIQLDEKTFRVIYYYDAKGVYSIATRIVTLQ